MYRRIYRGGAFVLRNLLKKTKRLEEVRRSTNTEGGEVRLGADDLSLAQLSLLVAILSNLAPGRFLIFIVESCLIDAGL